jgi:endogenous inhibitor of DNA gyrase (YacG/DUF329 family)
MISLPSCPVCARSVPPATDPNASYAPFCSRRCKEVDLIRWCDGKYSIVESIDPARLAEEEMGSVASEGDEDYSEFE